MLVFLLWFLHGVSAAVPANNFMDDGNFQPVAQHAPGFYRNDLYTIKILVVPDYVTYEKWLKMSDNDERQAVENMKFYYTHIFNRVNEKYQNLRILNRGFKVVLTGFHFIKSEPNLGFIENSKVESDMIDGPNAITRMTSWLTNNVKAFKSRTSFDGILVFTGYNIKGLSGVAFRGSICSSTAGGIIRDFGMYENIDTTAHEIGHMLGSLHDGEKNLCNPNDQFIMSTVRRRTISNMSDYFSNCSKTAITWRLQSLQKYRCLEESAKISRESERALHTQPGMRFSPDFQCKLMYGQQSFYCGGGNSDVCNDMLCWNPRGNKCDSTVRQKAADGTPCSSQMWCSRGRCIFTREAPRTDKGGCLYGDYRGLMRTAEGPINCQSVKNNSWLCYNVEFAVDCCKTCAEVKHDSRKGCEYGDKQNGCSKDVCHDMNWKSKCCETCQYGKNADKNKKESENDGCPNGDETHWCSSIRKSECYNVNRTCCRTCKHYFNRNAPAGCEYGDRNSWCPSYVAQNPSACPLDECCESCRGRSA